MYGERMGIVLVIFSLIALVFFWDVGGSAVQDVDTRDVRGVKDALHEPIRINNDTEFDAMAQSEGWRGTGDYLSPYMIENYNIDGFGGPAIYIGNTTKYFVIRYGHFYNSSASGTYFYGAVNLYNVKNGQITGNNISNSNYGVYVSTYSQNCEISYTEFYDVDQGVVLYFHVSSVDVWHNTFYNSYVIGTSVKLSYSVTDCSVYGNTIENTGTGIMLAEANYGTGVFRNKVLRNTIINPANRGIYLYSTGYDANGNGNRVENNTVKNSHYYGVSLYSNANHNTIVNNSILNCGSYGLYISSSDNNVVYNNTLTGNNGATETYNSAHVQAYNNGTGNLWYFRGHGNYWHDWISPDNNGDGIVDSPYILDGDSGSQDSYPLAEPTGEVPELSWAFFVLFALTLVAYRTHKRVNR